MRTIAGFGIRLVLVGLAMCQGSQALAIELTEAWTNVRALGMGNAYTAVVSDSEALFYNPAGLARRGGFHWLMFDPRGGINGMNAYQAVDAFSKSNDLAQLFENLYGDPVWIGGGSKAVFQIGGFAAGAYTGLDASMLLQNPAYPNFDLKYAADYGFMMGFGFDVAPQIAKLGFAAKRITRVGTSVPLGASMLASLDSDELEQQLKNRGTGYGLDLGFLLTVPSPVQPSLSFTWKNIGNVEFRKEAGSAAPTRIDSEMIIGAALEISAPLITITPAIDFKHVNRSDVQMGKKIHLGVEVSLPLIDIRAGLHQGYYTFGAGLGFGMLQADIVTYGVELGEYPGQMEDRRYMAQVTLELGLDPGSWGFGASSAKGGAAGGRRRLKQRR